MSKYAIVQNNVVTNVIEADEAYILTNHMDDIVIFGDIPIGYIFKGDHFISPEIVAFDVANVVATTGYTAPTITIITVAAMKARMRVEEFNAIQASTDIYVNKIWDDLSSSLYIDLNDTRFIQGVGYILTHLATVPSVLDVNVMTVLDVTARLNELIVDGTQLEKYNGVL